MVSKHQFGGMSWWQATELFASCYTVLHGPHPASSIEATDELFSAMQFPPGLFIWEVSVPCNTSVGKEEAAVEEDMDGRGWCCYQ